MRSHVLLAATLVVLSCGTLFSSRGDLPVVSPLERVAKTDTSTCSQQQTIIGLLTDLEKCEASLKACALTPSAVPEGGPVVAEEERPPRVSIRYVAKSCVGDSPVIEPVPSTKCMQGQLCLDAEGQRILAKNLASYAAWVKRVNSCEDKP